MAKVQLALILALCLSLNFLSASARPSPDDEDEDSFWSDSEEEEDVPVPSSIDTSRSLGGGHDQHKGHDTSNQAQKLTNTGNVDSPPQSWGGNIAGFNESCGGSSSRICNERTNLGCSRENRCVCISDHVYIPSQEKCYKIADNTNSGDCEFNDQCHGGKWGKHSRCERTTGRCQCYDIEQNGKRETIFHDDTCYVKRSFNQPCEVDEECKASMYGDAFCAPRDPQASPSWPNATQVCQCKTGHIWYLPLNACLRIATQDLSSVCQVDLQCHLGSLGNNSRCNVESVKCECHDFANPGQENVVFYKPRKTCFPRKNWNDSCTEDDECRASISSKAKCLIDNINGNFNNPMTCQCPEGETCPLDADGGGAFGLGPSNFNLAILTATVFFLGSRLHIM